MSIIRGELIVYFAGAPTLNWRPVMSIPNSGKTLGKTPRKTPEQIPCEIVQNHTKCSCEGLYKMLDLCYWHLVALLEKKA